MKPCDILFFDECHNLDESAQELLFGVIDDDQIPASLVPGSKPDEPVTIAPITLIFATDRPGKLLKALFQRIPVPVRFKPYAIAEMKEIVALVGDRLGVLMSPQAARKLAHVCHGIPRRAEHHVEKLRLTFDDSESRTLGVDDVRTYLDEHDLNEDGLNEYSRDYLKFLRRNGSASAEALAGYLGTDIEYLKNQIEQPLRFRRLVTIGHGGRVLTPKGKEWVAQNKAKNKKEENRG